MIHPEHKAFAQAVVALARQHGMDGIGMEFRFGFDKRYEDGASRSGDTVKMHWSAGRHGDDANIHMESRSAESIGEHEQVATPTPDLERAVGGKGAEA